MTKQEKRMQTAEEKKAHARKAMEGGATKAHAMRLVKKRFGSGMANRDMHAVYLEVEQAAADANDQAIADRELTGEEGATTVPAIESSNYKWRQGVGFMPIEEVDVPNVPKTMRRFILLARNFATGANGIGIIAEGMINVRGEAALERLQGDNTVIVWLDP